MTFDISPEETGLGLEHLREGAKPSSRKHQQKRCRAEGNAEGGLGRKAQGGGLLRVQPKRQQGGHGQRFFGGKHAVVAQRYALHTALF